MALKCRGADSPLNFAMDEYAELLPMLAKLSKARLRPVCLAGAWLSMTYLGSEGYLTATSARHLFAETLPAGRVCYKHIRCQTTIGQETC